MVNKHKKFDKWINRLIGLMCFGAGIYTITTKNYSDVTIVIFSVFTLAYWWNIQ